jgi:AraC-like DNA-binding protein
METGGKHMDKSCAYIEKTLDWVNRMQTLPIVFASRERHFMRTRPQPLLEFVLSLSRHPWHANVGKRSSHIPPACLTLMNAHFGNEGHSAFSWPYICISFNVGSAPIFAQLSAEPMLQIVPLADVRTVARTAIAVIRETHRAHPLQPFALKARVIDYLLAILRSSDMDNTGRPTGTAAIERALDLIADRYMQPTLTLETLAAAANLSVDHFGRIFRRERGISPIRYLTDYRLDRANDLLCKGQLSVKQVAAAVGYTDPLYFSRQFRARVGRSPSQVAQRLPLSTKGPNS